MSTQVGKLKSLIIKLATNKLTPSMILFVSGIFVGISTNMIASLVFFEGGFLALILYVLASIFFLGGSAFLALLASKLILATTWQTGLYKAIGFYFVVGIFCILLGFVFTLLSAMMLIKIL